MRFLFILFACIATSLSAQKESKDGAKLYSGKVISSRQVALKVSPVEAVNGDLNLQVEFMPINDVSFVIGAGIILPYYIPELLEEDGDLAVIKDPKGTFSIRFDTRFYFKGQKKMLEYYIYPGIRYRNYKFDSGIKMNQTDLYLGVGHQFPLGERFTVDPYISFGLRIRSDNQDKGTKSSSTTDPVVPVGVKIGFLL
jgi:hypothetical protein